MTDQPMNDAIPHMPGCARPGTREHIGSRGDLLHRCYGCGRYVVVVSAELVQDDPEPEPPAATAPTGRVCPAHQDSPVTVRGRGCPTCADERAQSRQQRRARRRRRPTNTFNFEEIQ